MSKRDDETPYESSVSVLLVGGFADGERFRVPASPLPSGFPHLVPDRMVIRVPERVEKPLPGSFDEKPLRDEAVKAQLYRVTSLGVNDDPYFLWVGVPDEESWDTKRIFRALYNSYAPGSDKT